MIKPIAAFITEINKSGANFPERAFIAGLATMPWIDMMDEFEQLDFNRAEQYLSQVNPDDFLQYIFNL